VKIKLQHQNQKTGTVEKLVVVIKSFPDDTTHVNYYNNSNAILTYIEMNLPSLRMIYLYQE
jgi:hypothetical protein